MVGLYSLILSVVACVTVGSIVFVRNQRDGRTIVYGLLTIVLTVMSIANYLAVELPANQLWYVRVVMFTSAVGVYLIYTLTRYVGRRVAPYAVHDKILLFLAIAVALLAWSDWLFPGVEPGHPPVPIPGPAVPLYFGYFILTIVLAMRQLMKGYSKVGIKEKRQRILLFAGAVPILVLAPITSFILPNIFGVGQLVALTPLYAFIFVSCVGYAIIRHGLLDIKLAVVRSAAYFLSLLTLAGVYFGLAYLVSALFFGNTVTTGVTTNSINIALALVLAFIFQPIKQFFDRVTNRIFFRSRYDIDELITKLGKLLASTTDLKKLLSTTAAELQSALKAAYVVFDVYRSGRQDVTVGQGRYAQFTEQETEAMYELANVLEDDLLVVGGAVDAEVDAMYGPLLRMLERRHVALVVPLGAHVGYLLLGDSLSGGYSQQDLKVLRAIGNELVIAIENAKSVQEVRELNTSLQQRIDRATRELRTSNEKLLRLDQTKDEFISMASHQLRTPLTSIKGYLSMVLEGDMGEVTDQQRKVLSEAYSSSERMVRLIGDFLNVSRLQTGKFVIEAQPTDIVKLIDEEVDAMRRLAESHDMTLVYKRPRRFPVLNVDSDKLRQVIMNFIDNAIYYSRPHATIVVKAYVEHDDAIVEVHDQGIGVPEAEKEHLFTKFFRAENARRQRPDGTGVGLFLARKIVTAFDGEVIFNSREGRGSVFGFRLPIKKLEVKK